MSALQAGARRERAAAAAARARGNVRAAPWATPVFRRAPQQLRVALHLRPIRPRTLSVRQRGAPRRGALLEAETSRKRLRRRRRLSRHERRLVRLAHRARALHQAEHGGVVSRQASAQPGDRSLLRLAPALSRCRERARRRHVRALRIRHGRFGGGQLLSEMNEACTRAALEPRGGAAPRFQRPLGLFHCGLDLVGPWRSRYPLCVC